MANGCFLTKQTSAPLDGEAKGDPVARNKNVTNYKKRVLGSQIYAIRTIHYLLTVLYTLMFKSHMSPKDLTYDTPEAEKFIAKETQRTLRLGKVKVHSARNVWDFLFEDCI